MRYKSEIRLYSINIAVPESMGPMIINASLNGEGIRPTLNSNNKYEFSVGTMLTLSYTGNVGSPVQVRKITQNHIKAYMKTYIPLETAAIFFLANFFLRQGMTSEYVMVDFIIRG